MKILRKFALPLIGVLVVSAPRVIAAATDEAPRSLAPYFTPATATPKAPDTDGFVQRWLLLEPINKPNRSNAGFVDSYVRENLTKEYFPGQFSTVPRDGDKVTAEGEELAWHAVDSTGFNVKLFRFAYGLNKRTYGVIFWAVTVVDCPREIKNVRLAVGSNSASMWWLNGKEIELGCARARHRLRALRLPRRGIRQNQGSLGGLAQQRLQTRSAIPRPSRRGRRLPPCRMSLDLPALPRATPMRGRASFRISGGALAGIAAFEIIVFFLGVSACAHQTAEQRNPAGSSSMTRVDASAFAAAWWASLAPDRRTFGSVTATGSMAPTIDSRSILLLEKLDSPPLLGEILNVNEGPGREHVGHRVRAVRAGWVLLGGDNNHSRLA